MSNYYYGIGMVIFSFVLVWFSFWWMEKVRKKDRKWTIREK